MKRRRITRRRAILLGILALLAVAALVWHLLGNAAEARWEERLAAIRAEEAAEPPFVEPAPVDNALPLLLQAQKIIEDADCTLFDEGCYGARVYLHEEPTEEDRKGTELLLRAAAPAFDLIDEALRRPCLMTAAGPDVASGNRLGPMAVRGLCESRAVLHPEGARACARRLLRYASIWRPRTSAEALIPQVYRQIGVEILRHHIERVGRKPSLAAEFRGLLEAGDVGTEMRRPYLALRSTVVDMLTALDRGEDPFKSMRGDLSLIFSVPKPKPGFFERLLSLFSSPDPGPHPPWHAGSWLGRPVFYAWAGTQLDMCDASLDAVRSEDSLRRCLHGTDLVADPARRDAALLMHGIAHLRIAATALFPDEPPRIDPFTGRPFVVERKADAIVVSSPADPGEFPEDVRSYVKELIPKPWTIPH